MPRTSSDWHEAFLARLTKRLSVEPSIAINPRCLSELTLHTVFDELATDGFRLCYAKEQITSWLQQIGLLALIPVDYGRGKSLARTRFYSFDVAKNPSSHASHLELLQAYAPEGTICFFTAIGFHSLSTQPPVHHHIAIPTETYVRSAVPKVAARKHPPTKRTPRNPLGTAYSAMAAYPTTKRRVKHASSVALATLHWADSNNSHHGFGADTTGYSSVPCTAEARQWSSGPGPGHKEVREHPPSPLSSQHAAPPHSTEIGIHVHEF